VILFSSKVRHGSDRDGNDKGTMDGSCKISHGKHDCNIFKFHSLLIFIYI